MVQNIQDLGGVPLRAGVYPAVFVRDVATIADSSDIVTRYAAASVRMIRTDVAGAVTLTFAPDTPLVPISARDQRRRYWMDVPEILPAMEEGQPLPR